jgi:hypothetical protein
LADGLGRPSLHKKEKTHAEPVCRAPALLTKRLSRIYRR